MAHPLFSHRIERLLGDAIERLSDQYPSLPIGVVSRCVEAARAAVPSGPASLIDVVAAIESAARDDLRRISAAIPALAREVAL